jgi:hypothetical protein
VFSGVFIAKEGDEEGDKGSDNAIMIDVLALSEGAMNMRLSSDSFNVKAFSWSKGKYLILGLLSSSARLC